MAIVARCAAFQTASIVLPLGEYVSEGGAEFLRVQSRLLSHEFLCESRARLRACFLVDACEVSLRHAKRYSQVIGNLFERALGAGIVVRESFECAAKEGEATTLVPKISACVPTTPSAGRSMPMCLSKKSSLSENANANGASAASDSRDFFGMKRGDLWRIWKRYCVMATAWKADTIGPLQLWTWSLSCKNPRNAVAECGRGGAKDGLPPALMRLRLQLHAAYRRLR